MKSLTPNPRHGFESEIGQQDISESVFRALNLKARIGNHLDDHLQLGITVADITLPEYAWTSRAYLGLWVGVQAAVAAQFGWVGIVGATTALTTVEQIVVTNSGAVALPVQVGIGSSIPSAGAAFPCSMRDTRANIALQTATLGLVRAAGALAPSPFPVSLIVPPGSSLVLADPWVLNGANYLSVQSTLVNVPIAAAFFFRERPILSSEL